MESVLLDLSIPQIGLLSRFPSRQEGYQRPRKQASGALVKEIENACFEHLVADRQHVVAAGDIEGARARDERG
jgi:hypothetical protein